MTASNPAPTPGPQPSRNAGLHACGQASAVLACMPSMTPARLRAIFERWPDPLVALQAVSAGMAGHALAVAELVGSAEERARLTRCWRDAASDPAGVIRRIDERDTHVWWAFHPDYPIRDPIPDRPSVLLAEGDHPEVLRADRVAIVGTRAATPHGLADARTLGAFLARAGVTVVSGLAIGIDGAAHQGALAAGGGVAAVIATGLDRVYPRRHLTLDAQVRRAGVVLSETGFGVGPEPGRFPVRNRIIAALADVVVVIEATVKGGARITADRAADYGVPVFAIPGSLRNASAAGCNELIADGAHPLLDPGDLLIALGRGGAKKQGWSDRPKARPDAHGRAVLAACGGEPATLDQLSERTGLSPTAVTVTLHELEGAGLLTRDKGRYWET